MPSTKYPLGCLVIHLSPMHVLARLGAEGHCLTYFLSYARPMFNLSSWICLPLTWKAIFVFQATYTPQCHLPNHTQCLHLKVIREFGISMAP